MDDKRQTIQEEGIKSGPMEQGLSMAIAEVIAGEPYEVGKGNAQMILDAHKRLKGGGK